MFAISAYQGVLITLDAGNSREEHSQCTRLVEQSLAQLGLRSRRVGLATKRGAPARSQSAATSFMELHTTLDANILQLLADQSLSAAQERGFLQPSATGSDQPPHTAAVLPGGEALG